IVNKLVAIVGDQSDKSSEKAGNRGSGLSGKPDFSRVMFKNGSNGTNGVRHSSGKQERVPVPAYNNGNGSGYNGTNGKHVIP
ncbi:MAG: hypothetical protein ABR512_15870, partial [Desulfopila sp.]